MTSIRSPLKRIALSVLPEKILQILKKIHYVRQIRSVSESEEIAFEVIRWLVNPGDNVADIGANIGLYTVYLSKLVGPHGCVYSIEPIPLTFEILQNTVKKLGLKNVEVINCAISDNNGTVTMEVPSYESGGENFYQARIIAEDTCNPLRRVRVMSKTLDSLFEELCCSIAFIKCDVEGHELKCIKRAKKVIEESKPAWLIEISGDPDEFRSRAYETFTLLNGQGYEAWWFDEGSLRRRRYGDRSVDYFFLRRQHLQKLQEGGMLG